MSKSTFVIPPQLLAEMLLPGKVIVASSAIIDGQGDVRVTVEGPEVPEAEEFRPLYEQRTTVGGGRAVILSELSPWSNK